VFDEADLIRKELLEEYGGEVPDEVAEAGAGVADALALLRWSGA